MIAIIMAALLAAATPPAQAAAPASQPGQPLREVTYHVTQGSHTYSGAERYEGYSSSSTAAADQGTVVVSVLSASADVLEVSVTETMNSLGRPATYSGAVLPDGSVTFAPGSIQDVTRQLLVYFGINVEPKDKVLEGSTWDANASRNGVDLMAHYKVTKVDGDLATLSLNETIKIPGQNMTVAIDGTIVMKPTLLVPITGNLHRTTKQLTLNGETQTVESFQFQRTSDTLDKPTH